MVQWKYHKENWNLKLGIQCSFECTETDVSFTMAWAKICVEVKPCNIDIYINNKYNLIIIIWLFKAYKPHCYPSENRVMTLCLLQV